MKYTSAIFLVLILGLVSCADKDDPNYQYFPDMYESLAYEAYAEADIFEQISGNSTTAMIPVEGSISRGWMPYEYEDNSEGYEAAKADLKNTLPYTEENLAKGKELYDIYCATCHGKKGNGKGWLVQQEKILGVPSYDDAGRAITEGSVYHVMYWGINTMGSYASQMSEKELWQVDHYVMKLKAELEGKPVRVLENDSQIQEMPEDSNESSEEDVQESEMASAE
jgi:mono/diheme cytochrome c family protein